MNFTLEVCCGDIDSVKAAVEAGAGRIELCSALSEGGVTPSFGLLSNVRDQFPELIIHVLIRPRGGDFLYSDDELAIMLEDIDVAEKLGADGVVIGALQKDGNVDMAKMQAMRVAASNLSVTFHRAFDLCQDAHTALRELVSLGVHRILTSGQAASALEGKELIKQLVDEAKGKILILPGGGVCDENACEILSYTGACELHASASSMLKSEMEYRRDKVAMGKDDVDEYLRKTTDANKVKRIIEVVQSL